MHPRPCVPTINSSPRASRLEPSSLEAQKWAKLNVRGPIRSPQVAPVRPRLLRLSAAPGCPRLPQPAPSCPGCSEFLPPQTALDRQGCPELPRLPQAVAGCSRPPQPSDLSPSSFILHPCNQHSTKPTAIGSERSAAEAEPVNYSSVSFFCFFLLLCFFFLFFL